MLKVLIVDDERLIRQRLRYGFEWQELGFTVEGEAEDGIAALEMIQDKDYDLAIVDIAMPGLNGVELTKELRDRRCSVEIIFLTGHSEFQYAKQAVTYGVFDYILKPVDEEYFINCLLRFKEKKEKQKITDTVFCSKLFTDYFSGKKLDEMRFRTITNTLEKENLTLREQMAIMMIQMESQEGDHLELRTMLAVTEKIISGAVQIPPPNYNFLDIIRGNIVVIFQMNTEDSAASWSNVSSLIKQIKENDQLRVWCGVSKAFSGENRMMKAYEEAIIALNNARLWEREILTAAELKNGQDSYLMSQNTIRELRSALVNYEYPNVCHLLKECFADMKRQKVQFDGVVRTIDTIFHELINSGIISEQGIKKILDGYRDMEKILTNLTDYAEIAEWCENFCILLFTLHETENMQGKRQGALIGQTCRYIKDNFQNSDLSQGAIASALNVSPPYLSSKFKKEMGISIVQYLTMERLEASKEYLIHTDMRIREISEKVGFHDEYYFSRIFKKYYGLSPQQIKGQTEYSQ